MGHFFFHYCVCAILTERAASCLYTITYHGITVQVYLEARASR